MAFDKTLPTNSTKIRNYPSVLTSNWAAIEEGDVTLKQQTINMVRRESVPVASNPTRLDDLMFLFSKGTAAESSEAYIMDDQNPANVIQITEGGKLGSKNTEGIFKKITIGTVPIDITANQYIVAWGKFDNTGTYQYGPNMSTNGTPHPGAGLFNVDVAADILQNANYSIFGCVAKTGDAVGSVRGLMPISLGVPVAATKTTIQVEIKRDGGRTDTFDYFFIQVVGGQ